MIDVLKPLIKQFLPFAKEKMGFERPPKLFLKQDSQNASNPLGKTAFYDPSAMSITLFVSERHPKDVMRSLSHELVHHTQNCNGDFKNAGEMGEGYAQNNPHMREMERQAYEMGNMCFRDWEDSIKGTIYNESLQKGANKRMSTKNWKDRELNTLLIEKWGFKFDPDGLKEEKKPDEDGDGVPDWADKKPGAPDDPEEEEEELEEGVMGKLARTLGLSNVCRDVSRECVKFNAVRFLKAVESGAYDKGGFADPRLRVANLNIDDAEAMVMFSPGFSAWTGDDLKRVQQEFGTAGDYKTAMAKVEKGQASSVTHTPQSGRMGQKGQSQRQAAKSACLQKGLGAEYCEEKFGAKSYQARGVEDFYESQEEPEKELYEMCPPEPEGEMEGGMEGEMEEGGVEDLAARAMAAVHELAAAVGADISTTVATGEEEDELEERRGRGRADPRNQRGPADPRQRSMEEVRLREALKGRKITEEQMKQIVRKTLELRQERKTNKG